MDLRFFCAIDEGMVLTAATSQSLVDATLDAFSEARNEIGEVSLYIGFECILRGWMPNSINWRGICRALSPEWRHRFPYLRRTYGSDARQPDGSRGSHRQAAGLMETKERPQRARLNVRPQSSGRSTRR